MTDESFAGKARWRIAWEYLVAVALCSLLLIWLLELWKRDLGAPLQYSGDALLTQTLARTIAETGWVLHNDRLGAPFGVDLVEFPCTDTLSILLLKLLSSMSGNSFRVVNLFFLLTFPLTTLTSLFVFKHFRCSYGPALVGGLLFAFLPYHFLRGEGHLFLSGYYMVPLMVMVLLWFVRDEHLLFRPGPASRPRFRWLGGKCWASIAICVLLGCSVVYYAFFACFFLGISGLAARAKGKVLCPLRSATLLIGVIASTTLVSFSPALVHARQHGHNPDAVRRNMGEAERYGMRIAQLLMPVTNHRAPLLAQLKANFNRKLALVTENDVASLGLAGSVGFVFLVIRLLARGREDRLLDHLCLLNVFAVLLATVGGLGLLCAMVFPHIRGYNRMSVYIAFFSLFALVLLLDALRNRLAGSPKGKLLYAAGLTILLIGGALDQAPRSPLGEPSTEAAEAAQDAAFVQHIDASVPNGAMIYQVPYRVFPEGGTYDHLRMYLSSRRLRWSCAAMRGRMGDRWNRDLTTKTPEELLPTLALAGYDGLVIDRRELPDQGRDLEAAFQTLLNQPPLVSSNQRLSFFNLTAYVAQLRARFSEAQWLALQETTMSPVLISWHKGFCKNFDVAGQGARWCAAQGEMHLFNPSASPRQLAFHMSLRTGGPDPARLRITGSLLNKDIRLGQTVRLNEALEVPPGRHVLYFACDAQRFSGDPRRVFRIVRFHARQGAALSIAPPDLTHTIGRRD
jgi:phosphoglycerol transferase